MKFDAALNGWRSGRYLHRHLGIFEPVDFVRFTRGLAAAEYRDERVTHALPKWVGLQVKSYY